MKRSFTITVDIDTERDQRPQSRGYMTYDLATPHDYTVRLGAGNAKDALFAVLTHEIGHILGREFEFPGQANDPRHTHGHENKAVNIIAAESEAWNLAARIHRAIFTEQRALGLGSYERNYGVKAENLEEV